MIPVEGFTTHLTLSLTYPEPSPATRSLISGSGTRLAVHRIFTFRTFLAANWRAIGGPPHSQAHPPCQDDDEPSKAEEWRSIPCSSCVGGIHVQAARQAPAPPPFRHGRLAGAFGSARFPCGSRFSLADRDLFFQDRLRLFRCGFAGDFSPASSGSMIWRSTRRHWRKTVRFDEVATWRWNGRPPLFLFGDSSVRAYRLLDCGGCTPIYFTP